MNKLKLTLIIQLIFFTSWGIYLLTSIAPEGSDIYLETEPVDPRDILSGTYVALSYKISNPTKGDCGRILQRYRKSRVRPYVKLKQSKTLKLDDKKIYIYDVQNCSLRRPPKDELWVRGTSHIGTKRISYGIEKFFINENNPLKKSRSGEVLAKVKIDRYGRLRLLNLELLPKI
ncbi:MAG: GDYXXLXY domain-containing protein [Elusimicrobiota bacterium]|nr:GDYXXLXY domain-containing protein [Elusimicrobiota bacterium]